QLLGDYEKLFADDTDDARAQLVLLRLIRASYQNAPDYSEVEQLAARIANPLLARWARGYCERFKADLLLRPYRDKLEAYLRDPDTSKSLALADDAKLQAIQAAYAAAVESLANSSDPKTIENLNRLCAAPLTDIE